MISDRPRITRMPANPHYELYQKMDAILVDELPIIPIYYYTSNRALSPKVKGWYPTLLDNHPYKYVYLEN